MNEKDLLKQLSNLGEVKPDPEFKKMNRDVLLSQLSSSEKPETLTAFSWVRSILINMSSQTVGRLSQPVIAVLLISVFVLGGGIASMRAAQDTKPGDSLYIAKIVSEKTQIALTFSDKKKAKLGLEFAGNRAKELNQVLAEEDDDTGAKDEVVEKLKSDFRKEISVAKNRIAKISTDAKKDEAKEDVTEIGTETVEIVEEEGSMFSANLEKDDKGIQTSEQTTAESEEEPVVEKDVIEEEPVVEKDVVEDSTSTPETVEELATSTVEAEVEESFDPEQLLEQAEVLLKNEDYDATLSKLDEAGNVIDKVNETGTVKGESEEATTTDEVIDESGTSTDKGEVLGVEEENASSTKE